MTSVGKTKKADDLCGQAEKLLSKGRHFEAEEKAHKALTAARSEHAFDRMARIVPVLCAARRARNRLDAGVAQEGSAGGSESSSHPADRLTRQQREGAGRVQRLARADR